MDEITIWYFGLSGVCATPALLTILVCIGLLVRSWVRAGRDLRAIRTLREGGE